MPPPPSSPAIAREEADWLNDTANYHDRGDIDFNSCSAPVPRAGRLLRAGRPLHREAGGRDGLARSTRTGSGATRSTASASTPRGTSTRRSSASGCRRSSRRPEAAGVNDFQLFGEVVHPGRDRASSYVRATAGCRTCSTSRSRTRSPLRRRERRRDSASRRGWTTTTTSSRPTASRTPPTFLGNHDMGRAAQQMLSARRRLRRAVLQRDLLAYDLLYLLRGAPVVYYGDEVGMIGRGGDKAARQDMFPTQVAEWQTEPRVGAPPIGTGSSFDMPEQPDRSTAARSSARCATSTPRSRPARRSFAAPRGRRLAVSRIDAAGKREYLAFFNAGASPARMTDRRPRRRAPTWTRAARDGHARVEHAARAR